MLEKEGLGVSGKGDQRRWKRVVILALILLLGLALRVGHLRQECPWYDEIITLRHLDAPDLGTFLDRIRPQNMALPPVYFTLEYAWARLVGASPARLRLLSVGFGMLTILLAYHIGRMVFGPTACLVAACGLAVNAFHLQFSQEIRMYALVGFLAAASAYTFLHLLRHWNGPIFVLHLLANALMVWTHPFALLVCGAEGALLVTRYRRPPRPVILWLATHLLIAATILIWLKTRDRQIAMAGASWIIRPTLLFRPDTPSLELLLLFWLGKNVAVPSGGLLETLKSLGGWLDALLLIGFFLAIAYVAWNVFGRRRGSAQDAEIRTSAREEMGFLLLWLALPPAILFGLSCVWVPSFVYRYMLYGALPAHVLIGGAVARLQGRWKQAAVTALVLVWSYQAALLCAAPLRPDWCAATVQVAGSPYGNDPILVLKYQNAYAVKYYLAHDAAVIEAAPSAEALAEKAGAALDRAPGVWVLLNDTILTATPASEQFETALKRSSLAFTKAAFPNASPVFVYRVTRPDGP